jgi:LuxR family maltose regulon positive regulatory protein
LPRHGRHTRTSPLSAAGLRLALNAARVGTAGASHARQLDRHVFDYLAAEVVDRMRPDLRDFLIRCSSLASL